ncbi:MULTISPECIES: hypothetical protein [unclassified Exiguobacterium]|uniref:hypothetical protein n=1 Tax=unclassified Exiguobacterium TaxID=2644629 RepID=UPI001BE50E08|nr:MULTISPECIES: hypothetical protein [unclassified Exiguobacterium]
MDNEIIGRRAVNAVEDICFADKNHRLEPRIPSFDKDISYDGGIEVYTNARRMKSSFLYKVPVQVKGKVVEKFSENTMNYRKINREDLEVYLRGNGVLFFVVEEHIENRNQNKVFFYPLLPAKIIKILSKNQKTYTLTFKHLPNNDWSLFEYCKFFKENSDKQSQVSNPQFFENYDINSALDRNLSLKMSVIGPLTKEAFFSTFNQIYINENGMDRPINFDIKSLIFREDMKFVHKSTVYLLKKKIIESENTTEVILNNVFHIVIKSKNTNEVDFTVETKASSLREKKITLFFLKELEKSGEINIFKEMILLLETVITNHQVIYDFFSINEEKRINLTIDDETVQKLLYVIKASKEFFKQIDIDGFYSFAFGDIQLLTYVDLEKKVVFPGFSDEVENRKGHFIWYDNEKNNGNPLLISIYYLLFKEMPSDFIVHEDLDSVKVVRSFVKESDFSDERFSEIMNHVVLNTISKYDLSKDIRYLEIANGLGNELKRKNPNSPEIIINSAQIEYRFNEGILTDDTKKSLISFKSAYFDNLFIQLAISILLREDTSAKFFYSQLEKNDQDYFSLYPIFNLTSF